MNTKEITKPRLRSEANAENFSRLSDELFSSLVRNWGKNFTPEGKSKAAKISVKDAINEQKGALINLQEIIASDLTKTIIFEYLILIEEKKLAFKKLAYRKEENKISVWVEVKDNDLETKKEFYLAGGEINSLFFEETKIYLDTLVVYERNQFNIPHDDVVVIK